jgi:cyclopropane fatty-acyl-phospholipid synthase-like methyltransferase
MNGMITHEGHLGGFIYEGDIATDYPFMYEFLVKDLKISSVLDVGCGRGFALKRFQDLGCKVLGIDGSPTAIQSSIIPERTRQIDFTVSQVLPEKKYDLVFSVEFVEHVEEQYMKNYLPCFDSGKYIVMTFAGPNQPGHHHVNCQPIDYWINTFQQRGFTYDEEYTNILKEKAKTDRMHFCPQFDGNHFEHRGLFFRKMS